MTHRTLAVAAAAALAAFPLTACMHRVDAQQVATIKRVGILSVTIDRIGSSPSDLSVVQRSVDFAPTAWEAALKEANPAWEVVPLASYRDNPAYKEFLQPDSPVLTEMGQKDTRMQFTAKLLHADGGPTGMVTRWVATQVGSVIGATGMPLVPWAAARPQGTTNVAHSGAMTTKTNDQGMHDYFLKAVGALAEKLGLDGMAVVYLHTEIKATVEITTVINGRGIDSIRMKPTMVVVNRAGKAAIDLGEPVIDDLSQRAAGAPVYRLDYHAGGRWHDAKGPYDLTLDLNDPQGKVLPDFQELITRTAKTACDKVGKEMAAK